MSNTLTVRFGGSFDKMSAPDLRRTLSALNPSAHLVIDCADVALIDTDALWVLVSEASRRANADGSLVLSNVSSEVDSALREIGAGSLVATIDCANDR
jgi:anti-anti-sigma factor